MADTCCSKRQQSKQASDGKKTVLFVPLDTVGHINSLRSIAKSLKQRGHRTVFLFQDAMDGGLKQDGHEIYDCTTDELVESKPTPETAKKWNHVLDEMAKMWREPTPENIAKGIRLAWTAMSKGIIERDQNFARKLELIKPDCFIIDHYYMQPALLKYGRPYALVHSASPLVLHPLENDLPPPFLGFPTNYKEFPDLDERQRFLDIEQMVRDIKLELHANWTKYLAAEHGLGPCPDNPISFINLSPKLNVYVYPTELDYDKPLVSWTRCDSILRNNFSDESSSCDHYKQDSDRAQSFEMPQKLANLSGKLIFLSMGTLVSGDVELMKNLVRILAKSPHKFIVSMGQNWDQYELADNMWGQKYVDQLALLPHIDLIVTHGGNNTITECFYYGVPGFIVCPGFGDQKDNAQRIEECKLGKRVNPFDCTETELLSSIEEVLGDATIRPRMKAIADRMQLPENKFKAIKLFREFVES